MLLFKPEHVGPILDRRKTETRRLWKTLRVRVGSVHQARLRMLDKNSTFAYLKITKAWEMGSLDEVTQEEAWAEGYASVVEYLEVFRAINHWSPTQVAVSPWHLFAVRFELVVGGGVTR